MKLPRTPQTSCVCRLFRRRERPPLTGCSGAPGRCPARAPRGGALLGASAPPSPGPRLCGSERSDRPAPGPHLGRAGVLGRARQDADSPIERRLLPRRLPELRQLQLVPRRRRRLGAFHGRREAACRQELHLGVQSPVPGRPTPRAGPRLGGRGRGAGSPPGRLFFWFVQQGAACRAFPRWSQCRRLRSKRPDPAAQSSPAGRKFPSCPRSVCGPAYPRSHAQLNTAHAWSQQR